MASVGPQSPTAATNITPPFRTWSDPTNCYTSDNTKVTHLTSFSTGTTAYLTATGFDFSAIPSGATIDGIVVEVERSVNTTAKTPRDSSIMLTKDGSTFVGSDKASGTTWPTTDTYATYGGVADLWGTTWTDTEIKASTFGVGVSATWSTGKLSVTLRIDHIRITVYYTAGAAAGGMVHRRRSSIKKLLIR